MTPRGWAWLTLACVAVAATVLGRVLIPWRSAPAPRTDQVAALRELPPQDVARARAFRAALRPPAYGSMLIALAVALLLGLTPLGARIVRACGRPLGGNWAAEAVLGGLVIVFIASVVTLPLAAWRHRVQRRFGLSTQRWGGWAVDVLKGYALTAAIGGLMLAGFYALAHYLPHWWWAVGAVAAAALVLLFSFVFPVLVEPVFNRFTSMPEDELRGELMAMAARDGVPARDVLVADASRRTRAVNAYVSGYGATRRIVVYDTLLERATPAEVRAVVAHELGHAKDQDVILGSVFGALGTAGAVIVVYLLGSWTGLLSRAGLASIGQPRSIALLLALAAIAGLLTNPIGNLVTRKVEARADAHALALTADPASFEVMQARLATVNLSDPDPNRFEYWLFASHPSTVERIAAARAYAREHQS